MLKRTYLITKANEKKLFKVSEKEEISKGAVVRKAIENL